ncbi:MAG: FtsX-like permease family protein [Microscillaceae bacterium]|nr:FtsX-like permease family protein [Microscillaceae bacterium]
MLKNYFKIAWRNLWRNRIFSLINLIGLALGIAAFVFILEYISYEYSYNRMHRQSPQIYKVLLEAEINGSLTNYDYTPPGLAPLIKEKFSEIKNYCRITTGLGGGTITHINPNNKSEISSFRESNMAYVDASFFQLFDFPLIKGNPSDLSKPNQVAISSTYSQKFFGRQEALGKTITLFNQFGETHYTIAAVFEDFPKNSDLQLEILLSIQTLGNPANLNGNDWANLNSFDSGFLATYFLVNEKTDYQALEQKINRLKKELKPESQETILLQPFGSIHLGQSLNDRYLSAGSLAFVYLIGIVGILILSIAWLNYINLSTALSLKRAKEVGIRKVIGARRGQLIAQFMGESCLLNLIGLLLAFVLMEIFQKTYNRIVDKPLALDVLTQDGFWLWGAAFLLVGTLTSGAYTAFTLSAFQPVKILKGVFTRSGKGLMLRKVLVVFQFSVSIALIASTLIVFKQLNYMQNTRLGMNPEQVLVIVGPEVSLDDPSKSNKKQIFSDKLAQLSYIEKFSLSGSVPSKWYNFNTSGITRLNASKEDANKSYAINIIDHRYLDTYQITLAAGQNFRAEDCNKSWANVEKLIINEKACQLLGFDSPESAIHQPIQWWGKNYKITGVLKDYHHQALQSKIEAMIFVPQINNRFYSLRIQTKDIQNKITELGKLYEASFPGNPYEYFFMDERYNKQYQTEIQYGRIFTIASSLAILIACLGLFGLAAFTVEQRTKEIGIRKVMGASMQNIVTLITRDFMRLVVIALVIAIPFAWYFSNQWLQDFAYKTEIPWWIFALAGTLACTIAFLTIAWHSFKAASANPVDVLRNE